MAPAGKENIFPLSLINLECSEKWRNEEEKRGQRTNIIFVTVLIVARDSCNLRVIG